MSPLRCLFLASLLTLSAAGHHQDGYNTGVGTLLTTGLIAKVLERKQPKIIPVFVPVLSHDVPPRIYAPRRVTQTSDVIDISKFQMEDNVMISYMNV